MLFRKWHLFLFLLCLGFARWVGAIDGVALVTAVEGHVVRLVDGEPVVLPAFSSLRQGEVVVFSPGSKLRLLYATSGRQEVWGGSGSLRIDAAMSRSDGLSRLQVSALALPVVAQIMKMPTQDQQGKLFMRRVRSIPTQEAVTRLEWEYRRLRMEAALDDLNPQLFLLAGLLEMREVGRLEQAMADLQVSHPDNMEAKVIVALYQKALRNMR